MSADPDSAADHSALTSSRPHVHVHDARCSHDEGAPSAAVDAGGARPPSPPPAHRVVNCVDVVPLSADTEEISWVGTAGAKVTLLAGLDACPRLRVLRLRSNLLASTAGLRAVAGTLEVLEVYDNQLRELEDLGGAAALVEVDASYNQLHSLDGLRGAHALRVLFAAGNRLRDGFPSDALAGAARSLVRLDLGANGLTDMRGVGALTALEELWLGKNRITALEGLESLSRLRILDVQSNRLTSMVGLPALPALCELYLAHNGISALDAGALAALPSLTTLDVTANPIEDLGPITGACALEDVWAGYTKLATFESLAALQSLPSLQTLYLEHAPIAKDWEYRLRVMRELPTLTQLDADAIRR